MKFTDMDIRFYSYELLKVSKFLFQVVSIYGQKSKKKDFSLLLRDFSSWFNFFTLFSTFQVVFNHSYSITIIYGRCAKEQLGDNFLKIWIMCLCFYNFMFHGIILYQLSWSHVLRCCSSWSKDSKIWWLFVDRKAFFFKNGALKTQ